MRTYEVYQFTNFPKRNPNSDKLISKFDYWDKARDFSVEHNTKKICNANGEIAVFPTKTRSFNGGYQSYKYENEGNNCYYVEEVYPLPSISII